MPARLIDFDHLWASNKLFKCRRSVRVEYAWLYGLADAGGSFELTNMREIASKVSIIRPELTVRRLKTILKEFNRNGLLFVWSEKEKFFGHWVGSRDGGRLPVPSHRSRYYFVCPEPPTENLRLYRMGLYSHGAWEVSPTQDLDLELELDGKRNRNQMGFRAPSVRAAETAAPAAKFAAAVSVKCECWQTKPEIRKTTAGLCADCGKVCG